MRKNPRKGELHPNFGKKFSEEVKEKMRGLRPNSKVPKSEDHKLHMRKPKSQSHRENIAKSHIGVPHRKVKCPHCNKEGGAPLMTRYHFDNCKRK